MFGKEFKVDPVLNAKFITKGVVGSFIWATRWKQNKLYKKGNACFKDSKEYRAVFDNCNLDPEEYSDVWIKS